MSEKDAVDCIGKQLDLTDIDRATLCDDSIARVRI